MWTGIIWLRTGCNGMLANIVITLRVSKNTTNNEYLY
jgi:hypothetical protein